LACSIFICSDSTARGDAREGSDTDLFFDYEKGKLGLLELMDVKEAAARILGRKTDIMTPTASTRPCGSGSKRQRFRYSDAQSLRHSPSQRHYRSN
jgi:predicted nucleotidyltransferase